MSTDRLKAKISALRAKTTAAGCTESEAMAAAELAARLMREHGLSEDELVMTEAVAKDQTRRQNWRWTLASWVAHATNTDNIHGGGTTFVGLAPGPQIAVYLQQVCVRAVNTELASFKTGTYYRRRRALRTKRSAAADFVNAMVERLGQRLMVLFADSRDQEARAAAERALSARYPNIVLTNGIPREAVHFEASMAGRVAGDRTALNRGMSSPAPRQLSFFGQS